MNTSDYISPSEFFKRLKPDPADLARFGFAKKDSAWELSEPVADGTLVCRLSIDRGGKVVESVTDIVYSGCFRNFNMAGSAGGARSAGDTGSARTQPPKNTPSH